MQPCIHSSCCGWLGGIESCSFTAFKLMRWKDTGGWERGQQGPSGEELQSVLFREVLFFKIRISEFAKSNAVVTLSLQAGRTFEDPAFADLIQEAVERFFSNQSKSIAAAASQRFFFIIVLKAALTPTPSDACYITFFSLLKVSMWA